MLRCDTDKHATLTGHHQHLVNRQQYHTFRIVMYIITGRLNPEHITATTFFYIPYNTY